jgi:ABC-2 type transport system ATP-binding protein
MENNILEVEHLSKAFQEFQLKDISFTLKYGTIMGFIGRNGAGKTTTMKSIINLYHPDQGTVKIFGKDFYQNELDCKQDIAFLLAGVDYFQTKKIGTITKVTRRFYRNFSNEKYSYYLKLFNLDESKVYKQLSNGMKVKYSLALALSHDAKLFILDEPTSGLDPISRDEILDIFLGLVKDGTRSILFSTHITSDLDKCAEYITYIKQGQILATSSKTDFIQSFYLVKGEKSNLTEDQKQLFVNVKYSSNQFEGLIHSKDKNVFSKFTLSTPDLETIMVYEERNKDYEESII